MAILWLYACLTILASSLSGKAEGAVTDSLMRYSGERIAYPERHDGGLSPVVGVHNIQTMRGGSDGTWLYNHQPMIAFFEGKWFIHYITNPRSEHEQPGKTMMQMSSDGYEWTRPQELFPEYPVPEGYTKPTQPRHVAHGIKAVMHQRVGWFCWEKDESISSTMSRKSTKSITSTVLLATANYGIVLHEKDDPNDGQGIGRVVRRVFSDGRLGPIHFIYYNKGFSEKNTEFPYYKKSKDKDFVRACDAMLADPLQRMQWVEEADRNDPLLPLATPYKAFDWYTLNDGSVIGMWKHALTSISKDGGMTWHQPVQRAKGFVNSNAKIWGQRLSDGTFATVYNPAEYRWPLALSLSADGLDYQTLNVINGEVTPERHWGRYKSFGPQYVRGIQECNPQPKDGNLWLTYSNNKEDIWVCRVPVPVRIKAIKHADGRFVSGIPDIDIIEKNVDNVNNNAENIENLDIYRDYRLSDLIDWNIYSPLNAQVSLADEWLRLEDSDPYSYSRVERVIPETEELAVEFDVRAGQNSFGQLNIEFCDAYGNVAAKIILDSLGVMRVKGGARSGTMQKSYKADETYHIRAELSGESHSGTYYVNGKKACSRQFDTPVRSISRIVFRTGEEFLLPNIESPADQWEDQPRADEEDALAVFEIRNMKTSPQNGEAQDAGNIAMKRRGAAPFASLLSFNDYRHYVRKFNAMEPEGVVQAIPNAEAEKWMEHNIPLFDCPDKAFEEIYYYRWWTFRKHIKAIPTEKDLTSCHPVKENTTEKDLSSCLPVKENTTGKDLSSCLPVKENGSRYAFTEFLVPRSYADKHNLIACAIGHHTMESRWLRNADYWKQNLLTWYTGNEGRPMEKLHKFSSWTPHAAWEAFLVDNDTAFAARMFPKFEEDWRYWCENNRLDNGLFWQEDVKDGMEESISGGRKKRFARPTINSYMAANSLALARFAAVLSHSEGKKQDKERQNHYAEKAEYYQKQGEEMTERIKTMLWNSKDGFFETLKGDTLAGVREAIGYLPWYCKLALGDSRKSTMSRISTLSSNSIFAKAWQQLSDPAGFNAPYGLTTAERRHPKFRTHGTGTCEWDGAVWPFATSQTLTALGNYIENLDKLDNIDFLENIEGLDNLDILDNIVDVNNIDKKPKTKALYQKLFFQEMQKYAASQHKRGLPYIGEYLDETTGYWLMGDKERSSYYNHSTFCDLVITGICGLRPQDDGTFKVQPLADTGVWEYFCIDNIPWRGQTLTIYYDKTGMRYHQGRGLHVLLDGVPLRQDNYVF